VNLGLELGTPSLTWRHLGVLVRHLPAGSSLHRAMDPDGAGWSVDSYLLANVIDLLAGANWQRGNAGAKSPSQRPRPMWRPQGGGPRRKSTEERMRDWKARNCAREVMSDGS
jgi:hypothetical protein